MMMTMMGGLALLPFPVHVMCGPVRENHRPALSFACSSTHPMQCALVQLPKDPYAIVLHSSFLIDVQGSYQSGYTALQVGGAAAG